MSLRSPAFDKFIASMNIDYAKWHDGEGYDLDALREIMPDEVAELERILSARGNADWRDVEALAALGTPGAVEMVRRALHADRHEVRLKAAALLGEDAGEMREAVVIEALRNANVFGGLTQALDHAAWHPTPAIVDALFRCALERYKEAAFGAAADLLFIHKVTEDPNDMRQRPFLLRFVDPAPGERETAFRELCERCGVDPAKYLK
jgi:hypothetical protein